MFGSWKKDTVIRGQVHLVSSLLSVGVGIFQNLIERTLKRL